MEFFITLVCSLVHHHFVFVVAETVSVTVVDEPYV